MSLSCISCSYINLTGQSYLPFKGSVTLQKVFLQRGLFTLYTLEILIWLAANFFCIQNFDSSNRLPLTHPKQYNVMAYNDSATMHLIDIEPHKKQCIRAFTSYLSLWVTLVVVPIWCIATTTSSQLWIGRSL